MARRKNRKTTVAARLPKLRLPQINWHRLCTLGVAGLVVAAAYVSTVWLMNRPIESVVVNGAFQRVSAMQLEEVVAEHVDAGFFSIDLGQIRDAVVAIPWVARATVRRRWPARVVVTVAEEVPAACWGEGGLLNMQGELFVTDATHRPAELPRLSGPEGSNQRVAALYFEIEEQLEQRGLTAVNMRLDARGAWSFQLSNGVTVRLGDDALDLRLGRFFTAYDGVISARAEQVDYIDMRYTNGFAVGWKDNTAASKSESEEAEPRV